MTVSVASARDRIDTRRSTHMLLMNEELARAHQAAWADEAERRCRLRQMQAASRLQRRAERAARRAASSQARAELASWRARLALSEQL